MHPKQGKAAHRPPVNFGVIDYLEATKGVTQTKKTQAQQDKQTELEHTIEKAYLSYDIEKITNRLLDHFNTVDGRPTATPPSVKEALILAKDLVTDGINVCFYGFGSKGDTVHEFIHKQFGQTHLVLTMNGNDPNLSFESAIGKMITAVQSHYFPDEKLPALSRRSDAVSLCRDLSNLITDVRILTIIVLKSYDVPSLMTKKSIEALAELSQNERITLVATVDKCDTVGAFSMKDSTRINFVFLELNTLCLYIDEIAHMKSRNVAKMGQSIDTIRGILESFGSDQRFVQKKACFVHF